MIEPNSDVKEIILVVMLNKDHDQSLNPEYITSKSTFVVSELRGSYGS
jgi:hypothetical protein